MSAIIDHTFSSVYSDRNYAESYIKYRWMPMMAFEQYFYATECYYKQNCRILDIGAGTGQISVRLASFLNEKGIDHCIDALDPSFQELQILNRMADAEKISSIKTINLSFENYKSEVLYDVVICSEMIHLVKDMRAFANNVCKILNKDGVILIRTPSPDQIWNRSSYVFFPSCKYLDLLRNKSMELIDSVFALNSLKISNVIKVDESQYVPKDFFVEMFSNKAFSTLHAIDESEYQEGLEKLIQAYEDDSCVLLDFKMTLYVVGE